MKKILIICGIVAAATYIVLFLKDQYFQIETDLYGKDPYKDLSNSDLAVEKNPSRTAKTPSSSSAIQTPPKVYVCTRQTSAYNPLNPSQLIGSFAPRTVLNIESKDSASGMYLVTYRQPDGKVIRALCRASDVGR